MRVGILGFLHESNTFLPQRTRWDEFVADTLASGDAVAERFGDAQHEIGGFLAGLAAASFTAVPLFAARALPYGPIERGCFQRMLDTIRVRVDNAGPLDGILVAPHGATVSETAADADGEWLAMVRELVGPQTPIVGTLDPHANLSPRMTAACDALMAYRTNPHIDQRERGIEAATLLGRMLRREIRPTMAAAYPPLAISIESQCTEESPCRELGELADDIRSRPNVLSASLLLGFPYADVPEMGSSTIVVSDDDPELAEQYAQELAAAMWQRRTDLVRTAPAVDEAIASALESEPPVCLLDMGDNVGGGSPGDGTWLANAIHERRIDRSLVVLCDQAAAMAANETGVGSRRRFTLGAHGGWPGERPLADEFTVVSLHAGQFSESRPTHGGFSTFDQGPTAVLHCDAGLTVVVTSRRMVPFSLEQLRSCGLDPAAYRILIAKGVNAPIAAYREVCRTFIRVNTPGYTSADMTALDYQHRRRPMFPFEPHTEYVTSQ